MLFKFDQKRFNKTLKVTKSRLTALSVLNDFFLSIDILSNEISFIFRITSGEVICT